MQMPLCLPEKITSGPAATGVMGAMETGPECIGAKGVAKAGGRTPAEEGAETVPPHCCYVRRALNERLCFHLVLESS